MISQRKYSAGEAENLPTIPTVNVPSAQPLADVTSLYKEVTAYGGTAYANKWAFERAAQMALYGACVAFEGFYLCSGKAILARCTLVKGAELHVTDLGSVQL